MLLLTQVSRRSGIQVLLRDRSCLSPEETSDLHKTEPYVYGQMIGGKDAGSDIGQTGQALRSGQELMADRYCCMEHGCYFPVHP